MATEIQTRIPITRLNELKDVVLERAKETSPDGTSPAGIDKLNPEQIDRLIKAYQIPKPGALQRLAERVESLSRGGAFVCVLAILVSIVVCGIIACPHALVVALLIFIITGLVLTGINALSRDEICRIEDSPEYKAQEQVLADRNASAIQALEDVLDEIKERQDLKQTIFRSGKLNQN